MDNFIEVKFDQKEIQQVDKKALIQNIQLHSDLIENLTKEQEVMEFQPKVYPSIEEIKLLIQEKEKSIENAENEMIDKIGQLKYQLESIMKSDLSEEALKKHPKIKLPDYDFQGSPWTSGDKINILPLSNLQQPQSLEN